MRRLRPRVPVLSVRRYAAPVSSTSVRPMSESGPLSRKQLTSHSEELHFTPQDRVHWMAPLQLLHTAGQVFISSLFGSFADKREMQVALEPPATAIRWPGLPEDEQTPPDEYWFDYVADIGDGFDATFSVAWLLGQDLDLREPSNPDGETVQLPRGHLLVLGGDEVYPTGSKEA